MSSLIQVRAVLSNTKYLVKHIIKLVYDCVPTAVLVLYMISVYLDQAATAVLKFSKAKTRM